MLFKSLSFAAIVVATSAVTFLFQPSIPFGAPGETVGSVPVEAVALAGADSSPQEKQLETFSVEAPANSGQSVEQSKPTLGVHVSELTPSLAAHVDLVEGVGLLVEHVVPESSAAKAGLEKHDVLVKLQGQWLVNQQQLGVLVKMNFGQEIELEVVRAGEPVRLKATLSESTGVGLALAEFDAFQFYHGQESKHQFQNCSLCHAASVDDIRDASDYDNYEFFHGQSGSEELKRCSNCHQPTPRLLDIRRSM